MDSDLVQALCALGAFVAPLAVAVCIVFWHKR
jgi:hypothetical protein